MLAIIFPFAFERKCFIGGESLWREENIPGLSVLCHPKYPWLLVLGGQGKAETAMSCQMLLGKYSIEYFLLIGAATALAPELKLGDFVLSNYCIELDFAATPKPNWKNVLPAHFDNSPFKLGTILSADRNVFSPEEKHTLYQEYQALAHAWEGAGFSRFLRRNNLLGCEIRCITELADDTIFDFANMQQQLKEHLPKVKKLLEKADFKPSKL